VVVIEGYVASQRPLHVNRCTFGRLYIDHDRMKPFSIRQRKLSQHRVSVMRGKGHLDSLRLSKTGKRMKSGERCDQEHVTNHRFSSTGIERSAVECYTRCTVPACRSGHWQVRIVDLPPYAVKISSHNASCAVEYCRLC